VKTPQSKRGLLLVFAITAAIGISIYGGYSYWKLDEWRKILESQNAGLVQLLKSTSGELSRVRENLTNTQKDNSDLKEALGAEKSRNDALEPQIQEIAGTVATLQKLSKTDPELLEKYSKVYFLNENYSPAQLSPVASEYLYDKTKPQLVLPGVLPFLQAMLEAAKRDGVTLQIVSAYRSFYEQASVKYGYKMTYGTGANQFSADQGYSEHQLGTACDFTTPEINGVFSKFEGSAAYKWLTANAYKFGFVLSYPKNNTYYQFEPWHWRFVSTALTRKLHDASGYFYELPQREIDQYLVSFFD
jgi:LAS superfamily LD-carboxypeptidase LdcB